MLVCAFFSLLAHETAGAARIRHSPRPLIRGAREIFGQTSGASRRENADSRPSASLRGALATKQSILSLCGAMDCFAPLAMTLAGRHRAARRRGYVRNLPSLHSPLRVAGRGGLRWLSAT